MSGHFHNMKYIHTIRHGVDMAFSGNQRQLRAWGGLFEIPFPENVEDFPRHSLKYWVKANQTAANAGKVLGSDSYLLVNFDYLWHNPASAIDDIIAFLNIKVDPTAYQETLELPNIPSTMGRYKNQDLTQFDPEDLDKVVDFGFKVEKW